MTTTPEKPAFYSVDELLAMTAASELPSDVNAHAKANDDEATSIAISDISGITQKTCYNASDEDPNTNRAKRNPLDKYWLRYSLLLPDVADVGAADLEMRYSSIRQQLELENMTADSSGDEAPRADRHHHPLSPKPPGDLTREDRERLGYFLFGNHQAVGTNTKHDIEAQTIIKRVPWHDTQKMAFYAMFISWLGLAVTAAVCIVFYVPWPRGPS